MTQLNSAQEPGPGKTHGITWGALLLSGPQAACWKMTRAEQTIFRSVWFRQSYSQQKLLSAQEGRVTGMGKGNIGTVTCDRKHAFQAASS